MAKHQTILISIGIIAIIISAFILSSGTTASTTTIPYIISGDVDGDCDVDDTDLSLLETSYGKSTGDDDYNPNADFNSDDTVDHHDLLTLSSNYGETCPVIIPNITSLSCSQTSSLKAQCTVEIEGLNSTKEYHVFVAGGGKTKYKLVSGATNIFGYDESVIVGVSCAQSDTYQLGAWVFEGTDQDVIRPALIFWRNDPVEIHIS